MSLSVTGDPQTEGELASKEELLYAATVLRK